MSSRERTLADLGESVLIQRIARRAGHPSGKSWALGIGDDAAILRTQSRDELVISTDAQVEDVHFRFDRETPRTIGRRAMAVNLSDLAAMGAEPVGALLSFCAPPDMALSVFDGLVTGLIDEGRRFACPLVGGNLSRAQHCSLTVTIIGRCTRGGALRRRGLRSGDWLYVTGTLGAAALARLRADRVGRRLHRVPQPRLAAGRALARMSGVSACIDLSDGLASDLGQLLAATSLGAEIDASSLPVPRAFERGCRELGLDSMQLLAAGGEDYELLFAMRPKSAILDPRALQKRLGVSVSRIGRVARPSGIRGLPAILHGHHF
jgi:thiamine-monophosphate kinase